MRCFLLLLLLLPGGGSLWAQAPVVVQSQRRLGHRINSEQARAIVYTRHRRLAVAGTYQYPNAQGQWVNAPSALWLLNKQGDSLTSVLYSYIRPDGFMGNYGLWAVAEAANGDLLMLGNKTVSLGPNGTTANVLLRTDSLGVLRWVRTYPGSSYAPTAIQPLPDNGALLVTNNQHPLGTGSFPVSVPTLLRVDSLGALVWQRSYGQPYNTLQSIVPLADGSYALAGNKSTGPPQWLIGGWVLRVNNSGDTLRSRVLGGPQTQFYAVAAAPGGGLVLGGTPGITNRANALVMVTDSLDQVTWQQNVFSPTANFSPSLTFVRALQRPGQVLVGGNRPVPAPYPGTNNYLAVWQAPTAPGATPSLVWEQQFPELFLTHPSTVLTPTEPGSMVGVGQYAPRVSDLRITRFANVPALYQVPYCQRPPAAYFAAAATATAVQVLEASTAGPRHAQLLVYRWAWGDGSTSSGPAPGAHTYATPPPPGTPVTLTVTNNLGCTGSYTAYPFGAPTAAQASRALGAALELYPNPTAGRVALRLGGLGAQGPAALALLDALGRVVLAAAAPVAGGTLAAELDLRGLPPGLYLLRVATREGTATRRLVRE